MAVLRDTIARLASLKNIPVHGRVDRHANRLSEMPASGSNPGELRARTFVPDGLRPGAPLVVVLHGCTQTAAGYDHGSGWSQLAEELGFALLFPEQQRSNNPNLCFNWFSPTDARRDTGEALSIRQMIDTMVAAHHIDERRIFVTGLSAGGAMTSIMLASYPELFAGGAIIAGLPYGNANSMGEAFTRMRGQGYPSDERLGALVRGASDHKGPWPIVSIWHGDADTTVDPSNADRIVGQWRAVHGAAALLASQDVVDGCRRQVWRNETGLPVIESYAIAGLGHGTPLSTTGPDGCGAPGPYMLEAGISSTRHIARFWGLADVEMARDSRPVGLSAHIEPPALVQTSAARNPAAPKRAPSAGLTGVGAIIEDALRAAGLMK